MIKTLFPVPLPKDVVEIILEYSLADFTRAVKGHTTYEVMYTRSGEVSWHRIFCTLRCGSCCIRRELPVCRRSEAEYYRDWERPTQCKVCTKKMGGDGTTALGAMSRGTTHFAPFKRQ